MSLKRELIYIDGKDQTDRIENYSYEGNKCVIVFKNSDRKFLYRKKDFTICSIKPIGVTTNFIIVYVCNLSQ
ncbi:hypothetical protein HNR74_001674 [Flammeovirga kamogawensis]|nr:hypothetical protein [Flammeovirga kamogawensis]